MSWGERSCKYGGNCPIPEECDMDSCTVNCRKYEWDKKTKPDTCKTDKTFSEYLDEIEDETKEGI